MPAFHWLPSARAVPLQAAATIAFTAVLVLTSFPAAAAQVAGYFRHSAPGVFVNFETLQTDVTGPLSDSNSPLFEIGGSYQVDYGRIRLAAAHGGLPGDNGGYSNAGVTAWFEDGLTLNVPGLQDFSLATLVARIDVSGSLGATGNGEANYIVNISLPGLGPLTQISGSAYGAALGFPPGVIGDAFGSYLVQFDVLTGVPFQLKVEGNADAAMTINGVGGTASTNLGSTINWGGIVELRDESGAPVSAFSLTSESGYDYATLRVVPVPAAFWLLGTGLLCLVARQRQPA